MKYYWLPQSDFRDGSNPEIERVKADFRFTPESGPKSDIAPCPKSATSRHAPKLGIISK
jgi:hypothetical protein